MSPARLAAELAFTRDLPEVNDKRLQHFAMLRPLPGHSLEVDQAKLGVQRRIPE